jgi:hypothetical protein
VESVGMLDEVDVKTWVLSMSELCWVRSSGCDEVDVVVK